MKLDLMGLSEVADYLGVSRQRADQLANTKGFPDEVCRLRGGRIWLVKDVKDWARKVGRK